MKKNQSITESQKCPFCQKVYAEYMQKCTCGYYFDKELYNKEHPNEKLLLKKEKKLHISIKTNEKTHKLGRVGRLNHFIRQFYLTLFQIITVLLFFGLTDLRSEDYLLFSNEILDNILWGLFFIICGATFILLAIISIKQYIKRLHDINLSGWNIFYFYLIPITIGTVAGIILVINEKLDDYLIEYRILTAILGIIQVIFILYVYLKRGTMGENDYGPEPRSFKKK